VQLVDAWLYQEKETLLPAYPAIWRTVTGSEESARCQNFDSTSSPTALTRPRVLMSSPGLVMTVPKPKAVSTTVATLGS
jgi:hypothetical protein